MWVKRPAPMLVAKPKATKYASVGGRDMMIDHRTFIERFCMYPTQFAKFLSGGTA